ENPEKKGASRIMRGASPQRASFRALMALEIRAVESKKDLETFLHVPWTLGMKSDPNWVPPLLDDYRRLLDPKKSPFLKHGEAQCFLALQDGTPVGRISAQIDKDFDKQWPKEDGV